MEEADLECFVALLTTLWYESQPLVSYLLFLVLHNTNERCVCLDWAAEYDILPMNLL